MNDEALHRDDDPELQIAEIAEDFLQRVERGEYPNVSAYIERYPDLAEVLQQVLPVLTMVGSTRELWSQVDRGAESELSPERILGDFKIKREIGRGGMGVVYEAQEMSLGRRVALKVLPFAGLLDGQQLARFKMEAQVAAQLHHTHIVPVFSVGKERGVHYYAMQYVDGQSLAAIIRQLKREARGEMVETKVSSVSSPSFHLTRTGSTQTPDYIRAVTRTGIQAAEALQHAHDHGVLHRDIKPSNLLLDLDGHLWITDFGLARYQNASTASLTLPGDVVGTLHYMSPEQAAGHSSMVDERADIYSLGASLYELLSLEPIFSGRERNELHRQIEEETPRSLCRLNPTVPKDLETIILKSLAKVPQDRYVTCRDLAEDLQRFLDHKPVKAKRPSLAEQLAKWSRRHRPLVTAGLVFVLVALITLCVSTFLIWKEKQRTEDALYRAQNEHLRAQMHYQKAKQAIDEITRIVEGRLTDPSTLPQMKRDLLLKAEGFYRELLETNSQDPDIMVETARSYQRIGQIHKRLGHNDEAETAFRAAIAMGQQLVQSDARNPQSQLLIADCTTDLAVVLQELGQLNESLQVQGQAVRIAERLHDLWPDNPDYLVRRAGEYKRWSNLLNQAGERDKALEARSQVVESHQTLTECFPQHFAYQSQLAMEQAELAKMIWRSGQASRALALAQEAVTHFEWMVKAFPNRVKDQTGQVRARMILATLLWKSGRGEEADGQFSEAVKFQGKLMSHWANPHGFLGWNYASMALYQQRRGRIDEAIALYQRKAQISEQNIKRFPRDAERRRSLAYDCCGLANLHMQQGQWEQAEQVLQRGVVLCELLIAEAPDRFEHKMILARIRLRMAKLRLRQGRDAEAVTFARRAKQLQDEILATCPDAAHWSWRLGWSWSNLTLAHQYGMIAEILALNGCYLETAEVLGAAAQLNPQQADHFRMYQGLAVTAAGIEQIVSRCKSYWFEYSRKQNH